MQGADLISELITGSKTADVGVKNAMMKALQEVVGKVGSNMGEASKNAILALIDDDASVQTGKASKLRLLAATNVDRCGGHDKCKTSWCTCQGPSSGHCSPGYQVCTSRHLERVEVNN